MGRCNPCQKAGVNIIGGEAALPTKPKKGRDYKRKINMQTARVCVDR